jgi:AcrR family transcriptional regulator
MLPLVTGTGIMLVPLRTRVMHSSSRKGTTKKSPAKRRSREEVVERLRGAACKEFGNNGYSRAKTAAIAQSAGVSETLLFKYFGSKAGLFNETIFNPIELHFEDFSRRTQAEFSSGARSDIGKRYVREMQEFFRMHSESLMTLIMLKAFGAEEVQGIDKLSSLHRYLANTSEIARTRIAGQPRIDPKLVACISFATILSCELFRDWLFPEGWGTEEDIHDAVAEFVFCAMEGNEADA